MSTKLRIRKKFDNFAAKSNSKKKIPVISKNQRTLDSFVEKTQAKKKKYCEDLENRIQNELDSDDNIESDDNCVEPICETCDENRQMATAATAKCAKLQETIELAARSQESNQKDGLELRKKYDNLKEKYNRLMHAFTESQLKLRGLTEEKATFTFTEGDDDSFTELEIAVLNSVSCARNKDASFIRKAMEMQYKNELEKLSQRSVKGTAGSMRHVNGVPKFYAPKPPLTPKKANDIRHLYNQRITKGVTESSDFSKRISDSYFNKILNGVLSNITNRIDSNQNAGVVDIISV